MRKILRISCVGFVACFGSLAEQSPNMHLLVQVHPEAELTVRGDYVVVKVRLAPSMQALVWTEDTCGNSPKIGHVIAVSGIYNIPLQDLGESGRTNICFSSTDNNLRLSAPLIRQLAPWIAGKIE